MKVVNICWIVCYVVWGRLQVENRIRLLEGKPYDVFADIVMIIAAIGFFTLSYFVIREAAQ